jgi:hypothetical protein
LKFHNNNNNNNNKRLLHDIFHIGTGISPRLPYQARQRSWRVDMGQGLIPGTIWKISCHNLFITYFTLTFSKHWLLYCKKNLWTDKIFKRVAFVQLANIFVSSLVSKIYQTMSICTRMLETVCKIDPRRWHLNGNSYSTRRIHLS